METTSKKQFEVAEIQLTYKTKVKPSQRPKITSSKEAYEILLENWDEDKVQFVEQFKIVLMNCCNRVLGIYEVSTGGVSVTVVDPKLVFAAAIKAAASSMILAHNHPSGQLKPSQADIKLTKKLTEGGKLLELPILDHIIVTGEEYFSFSDEGLL